MNAMETAEKNPLTREERRRRAVLASELLLEAKRRPEADLERERQDPATHVGKLYAEFRALEKKAHG
jgi:hypothetical protein